MKRSSIIAALVVSAGLVALDSEAAKRFGGGGNLGKQRAAPTQSATPAQSTPAATPGTPAATPAPAAAATGAGAAAAAKPSFMGRWGGLLAGLGIGALLAGLFGAQMGPVIGLILAALVLGAIALLLFKLFAGRRAAASETRTARFAGIGSALPPTQAPFEAAGSGGAPAPASAPQRPAIEIPGFEVAPFVRVAKTSFIRMQAANDSGDLADIRDFTTPEVYAEIAMQVKERNAAPQKTEVVSIDADVIQAVVEDGFEIASVRFWGLIRENDASNPEPFDEVWHVRKPAGDRKASWLISGIQQTP